MAIIAALMAVATPTGINALAQAKATAVAANFKTLQQAVIQMLIFEKTPPTSGEILDYIYANGYISTKPEGFRYTTLTQTKRMLLNTQTVTSML